MNDAIVLSLLVIGCGAGSEALDGVAQAVTSAGVTADYEHTVALRSSDDDAMRCSASLISPRVLLTAGHCLVADLTRLFARFETTAGHSDISLVHGRAHPDFAVLEPMAARFANDLAVLRLARHAPVAPVGLEPDAVHVGEETRVVGYGKSRADQMDQGTRRTGISRVVAVEERTAELEGESLPCVFDSGGPVLAAATERQVGVVSSGDAECGDHATLTRVDVASADFIEPYVAVSDAAPEELDPDAKAGGGCSVTGSRTALRARSLSFAVCLVLARSARRKREGRRRTREHCQGASRCE